MKEERKETSKSIRPMRAEERDFSWSKVKVSGLHLVWLDMKSVKGRKEGKDEEINREAIRLVKMGWRSEVPRGCGCEVSEKREVPTSETEDWCSLEELSEWEQEKEKRKIVRVRENTQWEREQCVKSKREFFFTQVVYLSVVTSIWYSENIQSLSRGFSLQGERVSTQIFVSLCDCASAVLAKIYS